MIVSYFYSLNVFVDDELVPLDESAEFSSLIQEIPGPERGGLFIGGIPSLIEFSVTNAGMAESTKSFEGTIKNLAFIDEGLDETLVSFFEECNSVQP